MLQDQRTKGPTPNQPQLTITQQQSLYDAVTDAQWKDYASKEWVAIGAMTGAIIGAGDYSTAGQQGRAGDQVFFLARSKYYEKPSRGRGTARVA